MRICLKQKIIALLLTIFMTLTLLPIYANAEVGGDGNAKETLSPPVQLGDDVTARGGLAPMSINPDHAFVVNETSYETLQQAIDNAISGDVIALQKTITDYVSETVVIDGKNITIDLGNENLTIHKSSGLALEVRNCTVSVKGSGKFNVSGGVGIHADRATITVHNVIGAQGNGVYAYNGGNITVLDNATGYSSGVKAESGGIITVHGSVSGYSTGVFASGKGSSVTVAMNVLTTNSYSTGVSVENGAYIEVGNDVKSTADNSTGVIATFASEAHIKGDVSASFSGVQAEGVASQVTVDKNITVSGANATGIGTRDSGIVNVLGNVIAEGIGSKGIYVGGGTVTVAGNVSASKTGVEIGVYGTGDVTIRGTLTVLDISHIYIKLGSVTFNSGNYITNPDMPGYHI